MSSSIADPGDNDVICGRGALSNNHQGNIRFRMVVAEHQPQYVMAKKTEKEGIARAILATIQKRGGKFLGKNAQGEWSEVDETKALLKTSQALREGMQVRAKNSPSTTLLKKSPAAAAKNDAAARPPPPPPKIITSRTLSSAGNSVITDDDVLCGRGGGTNSYIGNIRFRQLVTEHQPRYLICKRAEKEVIAHQIVKTIQERGGRFVSKDEEGNWVEIDDKKAILKSSQALREGMNVRGGTLKSPERTSKFAAALKQDEAKPSKRGAAAAAAAAAGKPKKAPPKDAEPDVDVYDLIAKLPTMPRPQLEALARALLCNGTKATILVSVTAMNEAAAAAPESSDV